MFDESKFRKFWEEVSKHGSALTPDAAVAIARENYAQAAERYNPDLNAFLNEITFDQDVAYCLYNQLH